MKKVISLLLIIATVFSFASCTFVDSLLNKNDEEEKESASQGLDIQYYEEVEGCVVMGIGTCTDTDVIIPSEYEGKAVICIANMYSEKMKSVKIPSSVKVITGSAFADCPSLESVVMEDGVEEIQGGAFSSCMSLKSIVISGKLSYMGTNCFIHCESLESVVFNHGAKHIGYKAFNYCSSLKSVTLPSTIETIESDAFYGCSSLTEIVIPASVTRIDSVAMPYENDNLIIYCEAPQKPEGWSERWHSDISEDQIIWGYTNN